MPRNKSALRFMNNIIKDQLKPISNYFYGKFKKHII